MPEGNKPAHSKYKAIKEMSKRKPQDPSQLQKLIGFFGWYQEWIPYYKVRISRWRDYLRMADKPDDKGNLITVDSLWTNEDANLVDELTKDLLEGPVLQCPDFMWRF